MAVGNMRVIERFVAARSPSPPTLTLSLTQLNRFRAAGRLAGYFTLILADAGWPPTLKRLPVSTTLVPFTFRIEKSSSV